MTQKQKVRISRGKAKRLEKLLHMLYKPAEIAEVMGVTVDTIYRSYLPAGGPFEKDIKNHVWIVGDLFAKWALDCAITNNRKKPVVKLLPGQVYCLRCNSIVIMQRVTASRPNSRGVINLSGRCPNCNGKVNRFCNGSDWRANNE